MLKDLLIVSNRKFSYKSLFLTKYLPSKASFSEIGCGKKIASSLTSSPNLSIDKVSDKFDDENNYSYEGANKEEKNENISVKSGENNEDNKKLVIYSSFSEINKKKDIGFTLIDKKDPKLTEEVFAKIKDEIVNKNNSEYCYYLIECFLNTIFLPFLKTGDSKVVCEKLYNIIKELLLLPSSDKTNSFLDKNICNLCHTLSLSRNFSISNVALSELNKIIDNYNELFGLLYKRISSKYPEFIKNGELLGLVPESRKVFEYSLNQSDLNFAHLLNFASEDLIVVEIELINKNPEDAYPTNKDILLYTNYHSKTPGQKRNISKIKNNI